MSGEQVDFAGKHFNVSGASLGEAAPAGKTPIYIAALGPQMLEMAGELADGIVMNWPTAAFLPQAVEYVKRGADKAGRDISEIDIGGYVRVAVGDDMGPLRAALRGQVIRQAGLPFYRNMFTAAGFQEEMEAVNAALAAGDTEKALGAVTEAMQDQVAVVGNPDHCRGQFEIRRAAGLQLPVAAPFTVGDTLDLPPKGNRRPGAVGAPVIPGMLTLPWTEHWPFSSGVLLSLVIHSAPPRATIWQQSRSRSETPNDYEAGLPPRASY